MNRLFAVLEIMSWAASFAVMLGAGLRLGHSVLKQVTERPWLFLRTMLAIWLAVPLLTIAAVALFRVTGLSATILLLMAGCPGIPVLLKVTGTVRGSMATAFVALLLTAATEPLLIPYWTRLLSTVFPVDLGVQPIHILRVLVPTIFLPIGLGFAVRAVSPRVAERVARTADWVYAVGIVGCVSFMLFAAAPLLPSIPTEAFVAAFFISVGDAIIGFVAGWPDREDQKAISLATALGNPALALAVVEVSYPDHRAAPIVSVYLVVRTVALAPVEWWMGRDREARRSVARRASAH
jgi:bile acid:Na+ symporter, BASS family